MARLGYLLRSVAALAVPARQRCPNCGGGESDPVARKYLVTALRRCRRCALQFRAPTDRPGAGRRFYDRLYRQGPITAMPEPEALAAMLADGFAGTPYDQGARVALVAALGLPANARVFEYGCSWGYGAAQFARAGFRVTAWELADTRRAFARDRLALDVVDAVDAIGPGHPLAGAFSAFVSIHVLEHVPAPAETFALAWRLLADGGWFLAVTPNGSPPCRAAHADWNRLWGEVHPCFIDAEFLDRAFARSARLAGSSPVAPATLAGFARSVDGAAGAAGRPGMARADDLSRPELVFLARKDARAGGW